MDNDLKQLVEDVYAHILQTANKTLRNCKLFSIEILQQEDPSYEQIAVQLGELSKLIGVVLDGYPKDADGYHTGVKAQEYAQDIADIARAIRAGDSDLLRKYVQQLDRRPFL